MANVTGQSLNGKSYRVVYGDPPWLYDLYSEKGEAKAPQGQYECMPTADICALMNDLLAFSCAPDCVFQMWTTFPMLARGDAHQVMRAAGFRCVTGGAWGKTTVNGKINMGPGYIYRGAAEIWLLGVRGEPKSRVKDQRNLLLDDGLLDGGLALDVRREHSRKPDGMIDVIERQFAGPYLETFARQDRPGWDVWGDQVGKFGGET